MLLSGSQLKLYYGEMEIFADVNVEVGERARIGLVGANGSGKTSLLRVLTGSLEPDSGFVSGGAGLRVAYVSQMPERDAPGTLRDEVQSAFQHLFDLEEALADSALEIQRRDGEARRQAENRYAQLLEEYEALGGYDYQNSMERVVEGVGLSLDALDTPNSAASGGERTRAALAHALLLDPDLLALDEPTNYLDFDGLNWLEEFLSGFKYASVVVSHDRYFLDRVCSEIWEMERGRLQGFPGNYSKYRELKRANVERQQKEFERQRERIAKEEFFIQRYKAGQRSREARGREKKLSRIELIEEPQSEKTISISAASASRTGRVALSLRGLKVGFYEGDSQTTLLTVPDIEVESGSRIAIVGANGIGKTTLLRAILGEQPPLGGSVAMGYNVQTGYLNQGTWNLPDDKTALDAFLEIRNLPIGEARDYLARFLFQGEDVFKRVSALSGGERTRLSLARLLITYPNVLILDEPTTHLDIASREALEDTLESFDGTLLFVSHDRHFIELMAERIWSIEEGTVRPFEGGFREWMRLKNPPAPEPVSKRARARRRRRDRESRKRERKPNASPQAAKIDYESLIHELESKVSDIEKRLEDASARRDTDAIIRLGQEHAEVQKSVEEAWERWALASG